MSRKERADVEQPKEDSERSAPYLDDVVELVHGGGAGEHGLSAQHLAQDAAHRPDVHALPSQLSAETTDREKKEEEKGWQHEMGVK